MKFKTKLRDANNLELGQFKFWNGPTFSNHQKEWPRTAMGNAYQVGFPVLLRSLRHSSGIKPVNKVRISSADLHVPVSNQLLIFH